jgi:hypothetical protein
MRYDLHPQAEAEFDAAIVYYEERCPGLGLDLAEEVYSASGRICEFPEAWTEVSASTRRCLVGRFPYGVIFQRKAESVRIIAVANLQRRPGYWRDRL